jgi:hypothetical protein
MRLAPIPEAARPKGRVFVPADFGQIIQNLPEGCPLVGGQAVAWWQQQYCPSERPITSCDIDFWGYREDLTTLARALGRRAVFPHQYEMTVWVGGIPLELRKTGPESLCSQCRGRLFVPALFAVEEPNLLRHSCGMTVAQVTVHPASQRASVFMAQPPGNGRNVHSRFNAARREQMA